LQNVHQHLVEAARVAVIGGGPAGVEIASELCEEYPNKEVYLFHSGTSILPRLPEFAQETAMAHLLQYKNLRLRFNERISNISNTGGVTTNLGTHYDTGVAYICSGLHPNSSFIQIENPPVNPDGTIKVDKHFQVEGLKKVFAMGDVAGTGEEFLAGNAFKHAKVVATNIQLTEIGKELEVYEPQQRQMGIMLGRSNAMIVKNGTVSTGLSIAIRKQAIGLSARVLPVFNTLMAKGVSFPQRN
jgi:NADH dehydrogenase FAD-containing subunit